MFNAKIPRKITINESAPFYYFVERFWAKYGKDFSHINLMDFVFLKNPTQKLTGKDKYIEIKLAGKQLNLILPQIKFLLIVYPNFNLLTEQQINRELYHIFCHVPQDYKENPHLKVHEIESFIKETLEFNQKIFNKKNKTYISILED